MDAARLQAGRRLDLALALIDEKEGAAAAELAREAFRIAPAYADARFVLGQALELSGSPEEAAEAYLAYLDQAPEDPLGASLRLVLLGERPAPERLPRAYVKELFDQAAPRFEKKMREQLGYRGPELLWSLLQSHRQCLHASPSLLDLGCGPGLAGEVFAQLGGVMEGFDLSPRMIEQARAKGLYEALWTGDLLDPPGTSAKLYELLIAADVFNYLGDLRSVFSHCAQRMKPGGLLLFTLEAKPEGTEMETPFELGPGQRYRHDPAAVRAWLSAALLEVVAQESGTLRQEKGQPVEAWLFLARRPLLLAEEGIDLAALAAVTEKPHPN